MIYNTLKLLEQKDLGGFQGVITWMLFIAFLSSRRAVIRLFPTDIQPLTKHGTLTVDPAASWVNTSETMSYSPCYDFVRPFFGLVLMFREKEKGVSTLTDLTCVVCTIDYI